MSEILGYVIVIVAMVIMSWLVWASNVIITERNRLRKETGKYYDTDIVDELSRRYAEKAQQDNKDKDQQ